MNPTELRSLLSSVQQGAIDIDTAFEALKQLPFADLDFAKVDHHREVRTGFPEVVFGLGKTPDQIRLISERILERHTRLLVTRVSPEAAAHVTAAMPHVTHHPLAQLLTFGYEPRPVTIGEVAVLAAGTSDLPVAEEAAITAELWGVTVARVYDVGVAGIHRLFHQKPVLDAAKVLVVVAGMEGALPSVVGGLVSRPVLAVPTSVGYGANFGGLSALLTMLNSCASGISVVNIDNGFGAGYLAGMIATG